MDGLGVFLDLSRKELVGIKGVWKNKCLVKFEEEIHIKESENVIEFLSRLEKFI